MHLETEHERTEQRGVARGKNAHRHTQTHKKAAVGEQMLSKLCVFNVCGCNAGKGFRKREESVGKTSRFAASGSVAAPESRLHCKRKNGGIDLSFEGEGGGKGREKTRLLDEKDNKAAFEGGAWVWC